MPAYAGMTSTINGFKKVAPVGIGGHDLPELPVPLPRFHRLLASDGILDPSVMFRIDKLGEIVSFAESRAPTFAMLPNARRDVACDADVERAKRLVGHDVDPAAPHPRSLRHASVGWHPCR